MNPTTHTDPLDQDEREFARILRALPACEPPAALDARILRAAADAAASPGKRRVGWLGAGGALWGIGSAAAAVLALGVGWQALYGDHRALAPMSKPVPVEDAAEADGVTVEFKDHTSLADQARNAPSAPPSAMSAPAAPPVLRPMPRRAPAMPSQPSAMAATAAAPEAFPEAGLDEHVAQRAEAGAAAESIAADASRERRHAVPPQTAKAAAARRDNAATGTVAAQAAVASDAASPTVAGGAAPAPRDVGEVDRLRPATWLGEVRALRDQGKSAEARARLLEFQQQYPHWIIPTDLAPLLRE